MTFLEFWAYLLFLFISILLVIKLLERLMRHDAFLAYSSQPLHMPKKYSVSAERTVKKVMRKFKKGTLKSGQSKTTVKSRKQAIAIGLSEARKKGRKVPAAPRRKKTS